MSNPGTIEPLGAASSPRRSPAQQRSRERLERILAAASDLIARRGSDHLKMRDVATQAEISIGSLYQYFPEKSAIIRALAERYHAESRKCIEQALEAANDLEGLRVAYFGLVDQYYQIVLAEPVMRDIWSGMQADRELMLLELVESRACGELLAQAVSRVRGHTSGATLSSACFLIWQLGESTIRLAISIDRREGHAIVNIFKRMSWREIETL
jgi:AcrR family transcriptional regulator